MIVVVLSYRQNVHAYPSGGGDYEVVTKNLGPTYGLLVASGSGLHFLIRDRTALDKPSRKILDRFL